MTTLLEDNHTTHMICTKDEHYSIGVAENAVGVLRTSMLLQTNMLKKFWPFDVSHACYLSIMPPTVTSQYDNLSDESDFDSDFNKQTSTIWALTRIMTIHHLLLLKTTKIYPNLRQPLGLLKLLPSRSPKTNSRFARASALKANKTFSHITSPERPDDTHFRTPNEIRI